MGGEATGSLAAVADATSPADTTGLGGITSLGAPEVRDSRPGVTGLATAVAQDPADIRAVHGPATLDTRVQRGRVVTPGRVDTPRVEDTRRVANILTAAADMRRAADIPAADIPTASTTKRGKGGASDASPFVLGIRHRFGTGSGPGDAMPAPS